jgi:hypothetical protein
VGLFDLKQFVVELVIVVVRNFRLIKHMIEVVMLKNFFLQLLISFAIAHE